MTGNQLTLDADLLGQCVVIRPRGVLDRSTYPRLRDRMLKHAVDVPRALIVDLSDVTIGTTSALSVFTTVSLRISDWPAVPLLVATGPAHAETLRRTPIRRYVTVCADVDDALANVDRPAPRKRALAVLAHHPGGPQDARRFVRRTCAEWGVPDVMTDDAVHVASELVQNTMQHTGSEARLRLELCNGRLTVAVGDDSQVPAVLADPGLDPVRAGKGLRMVAQLAKTWGCVADQVEQRKTVWAVLVQRG
ncbi:STAS domain-containing protein [Lentzea sp. NPDC004782]|uniref:STAS domain-containing protein n=1 Tax=Lentzea sp. NPDC004782 TaxID=3154458 RepID=UPI0033A120A1